MPLVDRREPGVLTGTDEERTEPALLARVLDVLRGGDSSDDITASSSSDSSSIGTAVVSSFEAFDADLEVGRFEVD